MEFLTNITSSFVNILAASLDVEMSGSSSDSNRFIDTFKREFGSTCPLFFSGNFKQAQDQAKRDFKFLLVYLHSSQHANTDQFCRDVLATERVANFFDENFICWGGDIRHTEAYQVSNHLQVTTFPYIAVMSDHFQPNLVESIEGPATPDNLIQTLTTILQEKGSIFVALRHEQEGLEADRRLREEQEALYQESLRYDEEQEELRRAEERRKLEYEQMIEEKRRNMPAEPAAGHNTTSIVFRLPDGRRINRKFLRADNVQVNGIPESQSLQQTQSF
eukprot:TRINITY_DN9492_c0_g1_i1.p1 TRINITY_DN9492_c0_g1~~TRINITY_DN9492_c0_g1_i1.p1  ORF type:complete len:276 (+),score=69.30 TRINITY_DN9492_c0_g1_i1:58-885(+)